MPEVELVFGASLSGRADGAEESAVAAPVISGSCGSPGASVSGAGVSESSSIGARSSSSDEPSSAPGDGASAGPLNLIGAWRRTPPCSAGAVFGSAGAVGSVGVDAVGVDWRLPLDQAVQRVGTGVSVQGNIDPAMLSAPWDVLEAHVRDVVRRGGAARAHVVNLGHGVPPETDPDVLTRVVELVHSLGDGRADDGAAQDGAGA